MTTVAEIAVELILDADDYVQGIKKAIKTTDEVAGSAKRSGDSIKNNLLKQIKAMGKEAAAAKAEAHKLSGEITDFGNRVDNAGQSSAGFVKQLKKMGKGLIGLATAYAAGRAITRFISDSVAAARAAGVESRELDRLENSWQKLLRISGEIILTVSAAPIKAATVAVEDLTTHLRATQLSAEQLAEIGVIETKNIERFIGLQSEAIETSAAFADTITLAGLTAIEVEDRLNELLRERLVLIAKIKGSPTVSEADFTPTAADIEGFAAAQKDVQKIVEVEDFLPSDADVKAGADAFISNLITTFSGLRGDAIILGIEFEMAGGDDLKRIQEQIEQALAEGLISPQVAIDFLKDLEVEKVALQVELEFLAPEDAAEQLKGVLGGTVEEAQERLDEFARGVDQINTTTVWETTGGISKKPIDDAIETLSKFDEDLKALDKTSIEVTVNTNYTTTGTPPDAGGAHGLNMTVPAGFPNDSFMVGVTSGEQIVVTPPGRSSTGGGRNVNIGTQNFFGIDLDEFAQMAEDARFME